MNEYGNNERGDIFSKAVRAGKRTYFFDVKATRANEYYLIITESKKRFGREDEKPFFEKHKIFLYREDFEKFMEGLQTALEHIQTHQPAQAEDPNSGLPEDPLKSRFTDIDYDDLGETPPQG